LLLQHKARIEQNEEDEAEKQNSMAFAAEVSSMAQRSQRKDQAASLVVRMDIGPLSVRRILTRTSSVTTVEGKDT
jgi:hypothetical protein